MQRDDIKIGDLIQWTGIRDRCNDTNVDDIGIVMNLKNSHDSFRVYEILTSKFMDWGISYVKKYE